MKQRRYFLLAVTLAAAAAAPAFGQAVAPTVSPTHSGQESAAPIPDFSGIWVHSIPGFEPLASGPTSLVNRSRRNGIGNLLELVGDYTNPILKPEAVQVVKRHGEISLRGIGYPTPRNQCWPGGVPFVFPSGATQLLQQPDKITILYNYDHQVRQVRLNHFHPAPVTPSWYGDSVGRYEGDTLIVDTIGIKADRPFAMDDMYGTPYTSALHVVERYRMVDHDEAQAAVARNLKENSRVPDTASDLSYRGRRLQVVFTVDDEGVFTMPWY